jgi:alkaline phosphatase
MTEVSKSALNRRSLLKISAAGGVAAAASPRFMNGAFAKQATPMAANGPAKSVIFYLGDGMGQAHRDAGQLAQVGAYANLAMNSLPVVGLVGTNSVTPDGASLITDSAAAATAFATGHKSFNGAIGVDADGNTVTNLAELAKAAGKSVGLVTTSQVTDASPAAFAAHVQDRDEQSEIARQYIEDAQIDVILGGGEDRWYPEGSAGAYPDNPEEDPEEQSSSDKGDLVARAKEIGYEYVSDAAGLEGATGPKLLGLFANEEMFQQRPEGEGDIYDPVVTLNQMVTKAIEILSQNPNGFLLFVEEEATDEFSHSNNATYVLKGMQYLEEAVQTGLAFAESNPDTLVLVTADHECGGLTIESPDDEDESGDGATISAEDGPFPVAGTGYSFFMDWTTSGHTGVRVPLTATGPGSEKFAGYYENTYIFTVLVEAFGLELPADLPTEITPGVVEPAASPVA